MMIGIADRERRIWDNMSKWQKTKMMASKDFLNLRTQACQAELNEALHLIADLTSNEDCWYDHHGYCQAHNLDDAPCPHERARKALELYDTLRDEGPT